MRTFSHVGVGLAISADDSHPLTVPFASRDALNFSDVETSFAILMIGSAVVAVGWTCQETFFSAGQFERQGQAPF